MYKPIGSLRRGLYPPRLLARIRPALVGSIVRGAREIPERPQNNVLLRLTLCIVSRGLLQLLDECNEFGEHHSRRSPYTYVVYIEIRDIHDTLRRQDSRALFPQHSIRFTQQRDRHFNQPLDFVRREAELRPASSETNDRVKEMAAHVDRQRRESTQDVDLGWCDADLFMRLSKRGLFDRFAVIETSTGQRDLSRVMTQIRSHVRSAARATRLRADRSEGVLRQDAARSHRCPNPLPAVGEATSASVHRGRAAARPVGAATIPEGSASLLIVA